MEESSFTDYYETLQISPNASLDTIDRMFRHFAHYFHPDNPETGDRARFDLVIEAHNTLKDSEKRAQYDLSYKDHFGLTPNSTGREASDITGIGRDIDVQNKLLSIFYVRRRKNVKEAAIGDYELEGLIDCPPDHLQFHIWYLKEKGWIKRTENGGLEITVDGIDHANSEYNRKKERLMIGQSRPI